MDSGRIVRFDLGPPICDIRRRNTCPEENRAQLETFISVNKAEDGTHTAGAGSSGAIYKCIVPEIGSSANFGS